MLEAEDGQTAYELLKRLPRSVQLVVTDIQMPRMDGVTLGQKLRAEYPTAKVLYMSGYVSEPPMQVPIRRFLSKPFAPDALVRCISRLCEPG